MQAQFCLWKERLHESITFPTFIFPASIPCSPPLKKQKGPHRLMESPQEVDLICQSIHLGLQLHFVHVGSIHILEK